MTELDPPACDVAALTFQILEGEWPTSDDQRQRFFALLGLYPGDGEATQDQQCPGTMWRTFDTPLPGVHGNGSMSDGALLGLCLFAYDEAGADGPQSRAAYPQLRAQLINRLGLPEEEWGPSNQPACSWTVEPLQIEMYCFQEHASGLMIGIHHAQRSAAFEANF